MQTRVAVTITARFLGLLICGAMISAAGALAQTKSAYTPNTAAPVVPRLVMFNGVAKDLAGRVA